MFPEAAVRSCLIMFPRHIEPEAFLGRVFLVYTGQAGCVLQLWSEFCIEPEEIGMQPLAPEVAPK